MQRSRFQNTKVKRILILTDSFGRFDKVQLTLKQNFINLNDLKMSDNFKMSCNKFFNNFIFDHKIINYNQMQQKSVLH